MWIIEIAREADKELKRAPIEVRDSFDAWKRLVEYQGPSILVQINGYWDHALKGEWQGARSSSLNRRWRVIYAVDGKFVKILVLRVTPHDYRRT